jgi:DnaJ-class molecular chaperone
VARTANAPEVRVLQALRQTNIISAQQMRDAITLLEATEACDRCDGTGVLPQPAGAQCPKCEGTGQMRTIR